jgi:hypothetical protein
MLPAIDLGPDGLLETVVLIQYKTRDQDDGEQYWNGVSLRSLHWLREKVRTASLKSSRHAATHLNVAATNDQRHGIALNRLAFDI